MHGIGARIGRKEWKTFGVSRWTSWTMSWGFFACSSFALGKGFSWDNIFLGLFSQPFCGVPCRVNCKIEAFWCALEQGSYGWIWIAFAFTQDLYVGGLLISNKQGIFIREWSLSKAPLCQGVRIGQSKRRPFHLHL